MSWYSVASIIRSRARRSDGGGHVDAITLPTQDHGEVEQHVRESLVPTHPHHAAPNQGVAHEVMDARWGSSTASRDRIAGRA